MLVNLVYVGWSASRNRLVWWTVRVLRVSVPVLVDLLCERPMPRAERVPNTCHVAVIPIIEMFSAQFNCATTIGKLETKAPSRRAF